ncbi:hypothetical protein Sango_2175100 [Sesamum angolense]|uniref:Uncharacterized protein n=1 Tax=Sesamum angolense TaxID=2727404 RepID=A0AAE1WD22_9LAMI|nr:hypothetical protein Sango_2175100 [Sesamum angolense]
MIPRTHRSWGYRDRALHSNRISESGRSHFSLDNVAENGIVVPIPEDTNTSFPVTPSALENISPLSVDAIIQSGEKKKDEKRVPWLLEYVMSAFSCCIWNSWGKLLNLSIYGWFLELVLARYGLQKLFGPEVVGATSDGSYMYLDLPSNMVGSFLMGWLGVVFKGDLFKISDQLAIGLTTGFLGSLTTFSGWNQKMLDLSIEGRWVFAVLGILIGLFLVAYSIIFGIETAKGFKWLYRQSNKRSFCGISNCFHACISNTYRCVLTFMVMLLLMLGLLWGIFGSLEKDEFNTGSSEAQLFLACMVGPFGVWIRWFLARLNGRGLGKHGMVKWMPFGTLAANVLAACVMAALATLKKAGLQLDKITRLHRLPKSLQAKILCDSGITIVGQSDSVINKIGAASLQTKHASYKALFPPPVYEKGGSTTIWSTAPRLFFLVPVHSVE